MASISEDPKISVIIPTFNRPAMLRRALSSLVCQVPAPHEVIVVNDGDKTYNNLTRFSSRYTFLSTTGATGAANARNVGVRKASGDWLLFLDDDDEFKKGYLKALSSCIASNSSALVFFSGISLLTDKLKNEPPKEILFPETYEDNRFLIKDFLSIGLGYGVCIRKDFFLSLGGFNPNLKVAEDTELFFKIIIRDVMPKSIQGSWVIKHEDHCNRLSSSFQSYSDLGVYREIFELHGEKFKKKYFFNYVHMLMWSYKVHRAHGNVKLSDVDLRELLCYGISREHIEMCYSEGLDISQEFFNVEFE